MPLKGRSLRWGQNENENELQNSRPISKKKAFWAFWDNAFWTTTKCKTGGRFECLKNEDWKRAPPSRLALICAFFQPTARLFTPSSVHFKGLSLPNKSSTLRFCLRLLFVLFLIYFMRFCSFRARWTHAVGYCWLCSKWFPPVREARRTFKLSRIHSLLAAFGWRVVLLYLSFGVGWCQLTSTVSRCAFQMSFIRHSELPFASSSSFCSEIVFVYALLNLQFFLVIFVIFIPRQ